MNLIERLYESNDMDFEEENAFVYFYNIDTVSCVIKFLNDIHYFDTDISYEKFDYNIVRMFSNLGFGQSSICLHNMEKGNSRYNMFDAGYCIFDYSVDSLECVDGDRIEYYASNELFDGDNAKYPGFKLSSGNTALYYTVGTGPYIRKYDIKLSENVTLIREFMRDEALFIYEQEDKSLVIRIKKPNNKIVTSDYILDNELELLEYLKSLTSFEIVEIYNKLCELSLGNNISVYPEISICESIKVENNYQDINALTIRNGNLDSIVRTVLDKSLTLYGNGNWNYMLSSENVNFIINSGKTFRYRIDTKNDKVMDEYADTLLQYDVGVAKREVEDTKKLVKSLGIGVKKNR